MIGAEITYTILGALIYASFYFVNRKKVVKQASYDIGIERRAREKNYINAQKYGSFLKIDSGKIVKAMTIWRYVYENEVRVIIRWEIC